MPLGKRALMSAQRAVDAGASGARRSQAVDREAVGRSVGGMTATWPAKRPVGSRNWLVPHG